MTAYRRRDRGTWKYEFQRAGVRYTASGFATKREALAAERERISQLARTNSEPATLRDLCLAFLRESRRTKSERWARDLRWKINRFFEPLYDQRPSRVSSVAIEKRRSEIAQGIKPTTANEYLRIVRAVFNYALRHGLVPHNPANAVAFLPEDTTPPYVPTREEVAKILAAATPDEGDLIEFLLHTLARRGSALDVRWSDVNFQQCTVTLRTKKSKGGHQKSITLPMTRPLQDLLAARPKDSEYVFHHSGTPYKHRRDLMPRLCKKAGVTPFGIHSLRRFGATALVNSGEPVAVISEILGHSDVQVTKRYLRILSPSMRSAMDALEGAVPSKPHPAEGKGGIDRPVTT